MNKNVGGFLPQTRASLKSTKKTSETDIRKANEQLVEIQESIEEDYAKQKKRRNNVFHFYSKILKKAAMKLEKCSTRSWKMFAYAIKTDLPVLPVNKGWKSTPTFSQLEIPEQEFYKSVRDLLNYDWWHNTEKIEGTQLIKKTLRKINQVII